MSADLEDSPSQFCADLAALLDERGVSSRSAAASSGWGKSTIAAARTGPGLPNAQLVEDVLTALGEPAEVRTRWQLRHARLAGASPGLPGTSSPVEPVIEPVAEPVAGPLVGGDSSGWRRHRLLLAVTGVSIVVVAAAAAVVTWAVVSNKTAAPSRVLVVQNKVAFGPSQLQEDRSPSYLAARPIPRCANVPGCKLPGTDLASGDTVVAVCQLQGAPLTNGDVKSAGIRDNPNLAASGLWYGIRWPDGRRGYLCEVYVAPEDRGGLGLPAC